MLVLEKGQHFNIYHLGTDEERSIAERRPLHGRYFGRSIRIDHGAITAGISRRADCPLRFEKLRALGSYRNDAFRDGRL